MVVLHEVTDPSAPRWKPFFETYGWRPAAAMKVADELDGPRLTEMIKHRWYLAETRCHYLFENLEDAILAKMLT